MLYQGKLEASSCTETAGAGAGHWKLGHTLKNLVLTQMQMLCTFALFSLVRTSKGLFTSFGFVNQQPALIAYTLFSIISAPVNEVPPVKSPLLSSTMIRLKLQVPALQIPVCIFVFVHSCSYCFCVCVCGPSAQRASFPKCAGILVSNVLQQCKILASLLALMPSIVNGNYF